YQELELRSMELAKLLDLERRASDFRGMDVPVVRLENWIQDARALLADLTERRRARDAGVELDPARLPGTPEEIQRFASTEQNILFGIEQLNGPRGIPDIDARLRYLKSVQQGKEAAR